MSTQLHLTALIYVLNKLAYLCFGMTILYLLRTFKHVNSSFPVFLSDGHVSYETEKTEAAVSVLKSTTLSVSVCFDWCPFKWMNISVTA